MTKKPAKPAASPPINSSNARPIARTVTLQDEDPCPTAAAPPLPNRGRGPGWRLPPDRDLDGSRHGARFGSPTSTLRIADLSHRGRRPVRSTVARARIARIDAKMPIWIVTWLLHWTRDRSTYAARISMRCVSAASRGIHRGVEWRHTILNMAPCTAPRDVLRFAAKQTEAA